MTNGFGLSKLKKQEINNNTKEYFNTILVGNNRYCIQTVELLLKKNKDLNLLIIREDGIHSFSQSLSTIRGEENVKALEKIDCTVSQNRESVFYKDLVFFDFNKRTKSEPLQNNESFFTQVSYTLESSAEDFITQDQLLTWEDLTQKYPQIKIIDIPILKLGTNNPGDLIQENNFLIELTNHNKFSCTHLVWGQSPYKFSNKAEDLSNFSDNFLNFCESTKGPLSLSVKFRINENFLNLNSLDKKTFFIPLSYTHHWGHFIGEFISEREILFVHYVDQEGISKEDIEKRIRLLKRQLNKAFDKFSENIQEMVIKYEDESPCQEFTNIDDQKEVPKNLIFIGENSFMLENIFKNTTNFVRGSLSVRNLKNMTI